MLLKQREKKNRKEKILFNDFLLSCFFHGWKDKKKWCTFERARVTQIKNKGLQKEQ
jgi:hypothetical protein